MANPIAAPAAATTKINKEKICPDKSPRRFEKPMKFILADSSINSIDIRIVIKFFYSQTYLKNQQKKLEKIIQEN